MQKVHVFRFHILKSEVKKVEIRSFGDLPKIFSEVLILEIDLAVL